MTLDYVGGTVTVQSCHRFPLPGPHPDEQTLRHVGVKRDVWVSVSELPRALSSILSSSATHSFPFKLMTTKSGLCKPIRADKKHNLCVSSPLREHKRESHIGCSCLAGLILMLQFKVWMLRGHTVPFY